MSDPFSLIYNRLWEAVDGHPNIGDYIKAGNRPSYSDNKRKPTLDTMSSGDLPELLLLPSGTEGSLTTSSSGSGFKKTFMWVLNTGDLRVDKWLHPIEWILFQSMVTYKDSFYDLQWEGQKFVKGVMLGSTTVGQSEALRQVNINGWSLVQSIEFNCRFTTSSLSYS